MVQQLVTGDGSRTLRHPVHKETYHSTFGALTESKSVFLYNSGVLASLQSRRPTRVLEIGFGTGLNFLVTADAATSANCPLDYVSVEIDPLQGAVFAELLTANFPDQIHLVSKTIDAVDVFTQQGCGQTQHEESCDDNTAQRPLGTTLLNSTPDRVQLTEHISFRLIIGNALTAKIDDNRFDAVYLDAFSPHNNPDLWTAPFLAKMKQLLADDAKLVSYCVSRTFRDNLTDAGYLWQKVEGPPGKREVLIARPEQTV